MLDWRIVELLQCGGRQDLGCSVQCVIASGNTRSTRGGTVIDRPAASTTVAARATFGIATSEVDVARKLRRVSVSAPRVRRWTERHAANLPAFALQASARQPSLSSLRQAVLARRAEARAASEGWWGRQDSNLRSHEAADLQSAPFATRDTPPEPSRSRHQMRLARRATHALLAAGGLWAGGCRKSIEMGLLA
jgi:hypothetical protein